MKNISLTPLQEGSTYVSSKEEVNKDWRLHSYDGKSISIGSIYRAYIPFKDSPYQYKIRPVIVLNNSSYNDKEVNVIPCTTAITLNKLNQIPYLKYPLLEWRQNGFDSPAYAVIDFDTVSQGYYITLEKKYILEPMLARNKKDYREFLMTPLQFKEILKALSFVKKGIPITKVNPKVDPKSESFDWKTMQIPKEAWEEYRNKSLAKDKEREETRAIQKEERLKQEFKNLRLYYLYDKDSKAVGDMSYSARIFKGDKPKRYKVTRDWNTYETYMGKYFPVISSMKDEIEDKFYSKLPTMNKEETLELKEHILSDEELKIFLDESL